jgi:hypothetical protein
MPVIASGRSWLVIAELEPWIVNNNVLDGVCRFYLFVVALVCAAGAASIYMSDGSRLGVIVLSLLCAASFWGAIFASGRVRAFLASLFSW